MDSRKSRRSGHQIPEYIVICGTLSLSVILGTRIARALLFHFSSLGKGWAFALGIGAGLLILIGLFRLFVLICDWPNC